MHIILNMLHKNKTKGKRERKQKRKDGWKERKEEKKGPNVYVNLQCPQETQGSDLAPGSPPLTHLVLQMLI